ncbi:MAG: hypothetical protein PVF53_08775 [Desulfobacterales bacterium]
MKWDYLIYGTKLQGIMGGNLFFRNQQFKCLAMSESLLQKICPSSFWGQTEIKIHILNGGIVGNDPVIT